MNSIKKIRFTALIAFSILLASNANSADINSTNINQLNNKEEKLKDIMTRELKKMSQNINRGRDKSNFVLSTKIRSISDISKDTKRKVREKKREIKELIRLVAMDIELNKKMYKGTLTINSDGTLKYHPTKGLSEKLQNRKEKFLKANLQNNVSLRSAYLALKLFTNVNNDLMKKAQDAKDRKTKERIFMEQAIYVSEMASIVYDFLKSLTLNGKDAIKELSDEAKVSLEKNIDKIKKQKEHAEKLKNSGQMTKERYEREMNSFDGMENAVNKNIDEWNKFLKQVEKQGKRLDKFKKQKEMVKYIMDKAELQISILKDMKNFATLKSEIGIIDDVVGNITSLELMDFDDNSINTLLGIGEE